MVYNGGYRPFSGAHSTRVARSARLADCRRARRRNRATSVEWQEDRKAGGANPQPRLGRALSLGRSRIAIALPLARNVRGHQKVSRSNPDCPLDVFVRVMVGRVPPEPHRPPEGPAAAFGRQKDGVEESIGWIRRPDRVDAEPVARQVRHNQVAPSQMPRCSPVDPHSDVGGSPSLPLIENRGCVAPVRDRSATTGIHLSNHRGIKSNGSHDREGRAVESSQVDRYDLTSFDGIAHLRCVCPHPKVTGEEILRAVGVVQEGDLRVGDRVEGQPYRSVTANHHHDIPACKERRQPRFRVLPLRRHGLGRVSASGDRLSESFRRRGRATATGDRIEEDDHTTELQREEGRKWSDATSSTSGRSCFTASWTIRGDRSSGAEIEAGHRGVEGSARETYHRHSMPALQPLRSTSPLWVFGCVLVALLGAVITPTAHARQQEFKLDAGDRWLSTQEFEPGSDEGQLLAMRKALDAGDPGTALNMAKRFLDSRTLSPLRAEALLTRGDATLALGDEYKALFDYEEIARKYAGSEVFVKALEREFEIAKAYAGGLKRKFFGTIRIVSTYEDAQELLIRIQERLPGSELAERAGMELADFYFRNRDLTLAAEAYDLFIQNYPKSAQLTKARLRLIYSYLAGFRGPEYDGTGLFEAKARLRDMQVTDPSLAEQIGADAILIRVYESEAAKLLSTANWYWQRGDAISAELFIRRLVKQYGDSVATLDALRVVPQVLERLPKTVLRGAPDYQAMRAAKLGVAWDVIPPPVEKVPDTMEPAAPAASASAIAAPPSAVRAGAAS